MNEVQIPVPNEDAGSGKIHLEAFDAGAMRKSRRNSFNMLRVASQINLSQSEEADMKENQQIQTLLPRSRRNSSHHEQQHSHGHHHVTRTTDKESMVMCVSALYGKLLFVIGVGFPIAKTLSHDLPLIYYNSFYLYLYFGSIMFIIYAYVSLLSSFTMQFNNAKMCLREIYAYIKPYVSSCIKQISELTGKFFPSTKSQFENEISNSDKSGGSNSLQSVAELEDGVERKLSKFVFTEDAGHGSMYLKMGTIIFGIGSMIYSGLEFGHYFELRADCSDILMAITPAARMVFTFLQMYFIFLNSRVSISRHTTIARFGIMHMVATNLCIWLNVLVEETKHTIHHVSHMQHHDEEHHESPENHDNHHDAGSHGVEAKHTTFSSVLGDDHEEFSLSKDPSLNLFNGTELSTDFQDSINEVHHVVKRASDDLEGCRIVNLMGNMVNNAAPLLFPCTIEYSLLCASVLYVMWKNVRCGTAKKPEGLSQAIARKVRHLYSVDCGRASRGLFTGIFVLVLTFISLILFYVLISSPDFKYYGILSANISEILIYSVGIVTTLIGMKQLRGLGFIEEEESELDNVLLVVAQGGVYMFTIFTLIGGYFSTVNMSALTLMTALLTIIQATLQTLYILDGSRRCCRTTEQLERKSGREMVTFLLMLNLSMWLLSTFQTSRAYLHTAQQQFYGVWAWTIISHVSMPLGIFYRFHATVCLGEIWKRAYKLKSEE